MLENHEQLHHTFFELYNYQGNILLKKYKETIISHIF